MYEHVWTICLFAGQSIISMDALPQRSLLPCQPLQPSPGDRVTQREWLPSGYAIFGIFLLGVIFPANDANCKFRFSQPLDATSSYDDWPRLECWVAESNRWGAQRTRRRNTLCGWEDSLIDSSVASTKTVSIRLQRSIGDAQLLT